jgi:cell division septation protein DedD
MTESLREPAPNFPLVQATAALEKLAPYPVKRQGLTVDGNWRVKSVAYGADVKQQSSQSMAASSQVGVDLERQKYGSLRRIPQSEVKSICRLNHLRMTVAACVSLLLLGGSWVYIREQARASQAVGLAASSEDHPPKSVQNIVEMPADPPPDGTLTPVTSEPPLIKAPVLTIKLGPNDAGPPAGEDRDEGPDPLSDTPPTNQRQQLLPPLEGLPAPVETAEAVRSAGVSDSSSGSSRGNAPTQAPSDATVVTNEARPSKVASASPPSSKVAVSAAARELKPPSTKVKPTPERIAITPTIASGSSSMAAPEGRYRIQLAAVRQEVDARRTWDLVRGELDLVLSGMQPFIERADTASGVFYRVQIGPVDNLDEAEARCDEIKRRKARCFVIRN